MLHAMIMAGGGGTRFWPRSRQKKPKQFLNLVGDRTLLQQTVERIEGMVPNEQILVLTAGVHRAECIKQLPQLPPENIIGEPCGRDTAPCIGLGASLVAQRDPDAVMCVMPADHIIEPAQEFRRAIHVAQQMALDNPAALVTLGIPPTYPATGFGYIHRGAEIAQRQQLSVYKVQSFREKPKFEQAEQFVFSGEYYWNAGIFIWKASTILGALAANQPKLHENVQKIAAHWNGPKRDAVLQAEYEGCPKISIDYAVMEKAKDVLVVPAPFRWDDVGSWLALERMHAQDAACNTVLARHCGLKTKNCLIVGDSNQLIATVGVEDLLIIHDGDAILVAHRSEEATVKDMVAELKARGLEIHL